MNAQSNAIERALVAGGIPYKVFGGVKFYDRKEIKDIISYLSVINNENDILRLKRIINEPKRGIGAASVDLLEQISANLSETPLQVMREAGDIPLLSRASSKLTELAAVFDELREHSALIPLPELLDELLEKTGYMTYLKSQGDEGAGRLENVNELKSTMTNYEQNAEEPSLSGFLEEIALYTDIDDMNPEDDSVILMTVHAAKGLEFDNVFVVGVEENIFPSSRSLGSEADIEEERRLAYVAITRARKRLYISCSRQRMLFGSTSFNKQSRFVDELPKSAITVKSEQSEQTESSRSYNPQPKTQNSFAAQLEKMKHGAATSGSRALSFSIGDRVSHNVFGEGTVLNATKMSNDVMLEISFDKVGTKKIMAAFARIKKI